MLRGRWAILALCACAACAHALPAPPHPLLVGAEGEAVPHFFARVLVDACTRRESSEVLIGLAVEAEGACPEPWSPGCNQAVCAWLHGDEGCAETRFRHTRTR